MYKTYVAFLLIFFACQTSNANPDLTDSNPCNDICKFHLYAASTSNNDDMNRTRKAFPECFNASALARTLQYAVARGDTHASKRLSIEHYKYRLAEDSSVIDKVGQCFSRGIKEEAGSQLYALSFGLTVGSLLAGYQSKDTSQESISYNLPLIVAGTMGFASGLWCGSQQKQEKKEQSVMQRFEKCVQQRNFKGVQELQPALYKAEYGFKFKPCFKSKGDALITVLTTGSASGLAYRGVSSLNTKDNISRSHPLSLVGAFGLGSYGGFYAGKSFKKWWTS